MTTSDRLNEQVSNIDNVLSRINDCYEPKRYAIQPSDLESARKATNTEPTKEEIENDSYQKGMLVYCDKLAIEIENPAGTYRTGTDPEGKTWSSLMNFDYGEVHLTDGSDGDPVDVFIGNDLTSGMVYVIDQADAEGNFDEHKAMLCFSSKEDAIKGYQSCYEKGWDRILSVTTCTAEEFQKWCNSRNSKELASETLPRGRENQKEPSASLIKPDRSL